MEVSAKTAIKQAANNGRYKEAWQYRELGSAHGILLGFSEGWGGRSFAFMARLKQAWVTVWIKEVFLGDRVS